MWASSFKVSPAAAAWIAMTVIASAGPLTSESDVPTGDVWITQDVPAPLPSQAAQNVPLRRLLPTGDFWPTDDGDGATRTADTPAPPKSALAEETTAGGMK